MSDYSHYVRKFALPVGLFLAYCAVARIGLYIHPLDAHPTLVLSPGGIALAAILLYGYRASAAIAVAVFAVALFAGASPLVALVLSAAGTLAPLAGAYVLRNFLVFSASLQRLVDISGILVAAVLSAAISATLEMGAFFLAGLTADTLSSSIWLTHWVGDMLGVVLFAPFILKWCTRPLSGRSTKLRIEKYATVAAVSITSFLIFWMPQTHFAYYFVFMPLTWAALRTGQRGTSLSLMCFGTIAVFGTALGYGPFIDQGLLLMIFIVTTGALLYIVSGVVESRKLGFRMLEGHVDDLEKALHQMSSEDVAKTKFLSVLAHELRNPLAAVLSSVELLKISAGQNRDTAEQLGTIDEQVNVMAGLLDDLLDISRISHDKLILKRETVSLNDIVDRSVRAAQAMVLRREHTLTVAKPSEDIPLDADPIRLEQIMLNLLSNATKYTEPHGSIKLSAKIEDSMAVIRVRDTGIGIPRHLLARIFEPYYQIERGQVLTEGLGVGLSLTRQLVQMHGGTIEAVSEGEHQGSEFIVRLPVTVHTKAPPAKKAKDSSSSKTPVVAHHALKVLVVDDNAGVTDALGRLLSLAGHEVVRAYAGAEAIQKARQFHPDVAILDIGLPDMTGYEVARRLRDTTGFTGSLIALTGYGQEHDKKMARDAGFYKHLTKPVSFKNIEAALRKIAHSKVNNLST